KDDYLAGRYRSYYGQHLDPHVNTRLFKRSSPHWYSMHGVGLSAVLVPAFWLDGASGATVMMVLIAAVVLVLTCLWVRRFTCVACVRSGSACPPRRSRTQSTAAGTCRAHPRVRDRLRAQHSSLVCLLAADSDGPSGQCGIQAKRGSRTGRGVLRFIPRSPHEQ